MLRRGRVTAAVRCGGRSGGGAAVGRHVGIHQGDPPPPPTRAHVLLATALRAPCAAEPPPPPPVPPASAPRRSADTYRAARAGPAGQEEGWARPSSGSRCVRADDSGPCFHGWAALDWPAPVSPPPRSRADGDVTGTRRQARGCGAADGRRRMVCGAKAFWVRCGDCRCRA